MIGLDTLWTTLHSAIGVTAGVGVAILAYVLVRMVLDSL